MHSSFPVQATKVTTNVTNLPCICTLCIKQKYIVVSNNLCIAYCGSLFKGKPSRDSRSQPGCQAVKERLLELDLGLLLYPSRPIFVFTFSLWNLNIPLHHTVIVMLLYWIRMNVLFYYVMWVWFSFEEHHVAYVCRLSWAMICTWIAEYWITFLLFCSYQHH